MEMEEYEYGYTKPLPTLQPPDIYAVPGEMQTTPAAPSLQYTPTASKPDTEPVVAKIPTQKLKLSIAIKINILIAACIINFMLLILGIVILSFFVGQTATKAEVGAQQGSTGPQGPIGEMGLPIVGGWICIDSLYIQISRAYRLLWRTPKIQAHVLSTHVR
jgi:hypothetical protein